MKFPDARIAFCPKHLEPFRADWPRGYAELVVKILGPVVKDERFSAQFPVREDGKRVFDEEEASALLERLSPLCCFVGDDLMELLTAEALGRVN